MIYITFRSFPQVESDMFFFCFVFLHVLSYPSPMVKEERFHRQEFHFNDPDSFDYVWGTQVFHVIDGSDSGDSYKKSVCSAQ